MPPRVTLRDLASATGLHFTTVGLALRRDPRVNAQTLTVVEAAARRLGYQRDAMLSALSAYRHTRKWVFQGTIGYLLPASLRQMMDRNDGYRTAYESARAAAEALGLRIEAVNAGGPDLTGRRLAQLLEARGIGALADRGPWIDAGTAGPAPTGRVNGSIPPYPQTESAS